MTTYVHKIYEDELCRLLRTTPDRLPKLRKKEGLPAPANSDDKGAYWSIPAVRRWISDSGRFTPEKWLLEWWPDATRPADYLGAQVMRHRELDPPSAVVQVWSTSHGTVVIGWGMNGNTPHEQDMRRVVADAAAYLYIGFGFGLSGPDVFTWDPSDGEHTDVEWRDLARVMGRPMPFWPHPLRIPELIAGWQPGDAPVRHHGTPGLDVGPLLEMAMLHHPDDPIHRAMIHTAQSVHSTVLPVLDLEILEEKFASNAITRDQIAVAALPAPQIEEPRELDDTTLRSGWREVQRRDDWLAEQCMLVLSAWDGGRNLTHAQTVDIGLDRAPAREIVARLEPASRTAQYMLLDPHRTGEAYLDPLTDAPVTVDRDENTVSMLVPTRLPTLSPLAEIVLDGRVWVRTQDGSLYPAPCDSYYGLNWGYDGSGTQALALLAERLLDEISSPGARLGTAASPGLRSLFVKKWPDGTVLTRAQLESARNA